MVFSCLDRRHVKRCSFLPWFCAELTLKLAPHGSMTDVKLILLVAIDVIVTSRLCFTGLTYV